MVSASLSCGKTSAGLLALLAIGLGCLRLPPGDAVAQICEAAVWFKDNPPGVSLATEGNARAFVSACREVFPSLGEGVRQRLTDMQEAQTLDKTLPCPEICPPMCNKKLPKSLVGTCAAGFQHKADKDMTKEEATLWRKSGIRPLAARFIDPSQILAMWKRGEVAKFDATKVLPARLFNVSIRDLSSLVGEERARKIPFRVRLAYGAQSSPATAHFRHIMPSDCEEGLRYLKKVHQRHGTQSLYTKVARLLLVPLLIQFKCHEEPSLADVVELAEQFDPTAVAWSPVNLTKQRLAEAEYDKRLRANHAIGNSNINTRRLPEFLKGVDLAAKIGIKSMIINQYNYLWFGITGGDIHPDAQDNILVQLTGDVEAVIVPPNCSTLVFESAFNKLPPYKGVADFYLRNPMPLWHIKVKQGQGIVIPSRAAHRIISPSSRRVGLNAFFEPKFGQMQWKGQPHNFYNMQNPNTAAMRVLWMRSAERLYEQTGRVLAMHTSKLEYI